MYKLKLHAPEWVHAKKNKILQIFQNENENESVNIYIWNLLRFEVQNKKFFSLFSKNYSLWREKILVIIEKNTRNYEKNFCTSNLI